jgi:hypothetical protein
MNDNQPIPIAFSVTSARVNHYSDVVEYMAAQEINRFKSEHGRAPLQSQIDFLKKELVRYVVIRRDIDTAQSLRIKPSNLLNEGRISTRVE